MTATLGTRRHFPSNTFSLSAICLGLGGDPKLLGRADDLRAFIQNGKQVATVEIELQPHPGQTPHVFRRVLDARKGSDSARSRGRGSSTCYINGEKVSVQAVRELVQNTYKISIENMCTFLPQDKVGDFSGLNDQDRLIETEKTFSGGGQNQYYYNVHQELIQAEEDVRNSKGNVDTVKDQLEKLKHEKENLQREKDRMDERKKAEEQLDLYRKKKLWLEVEDIRAKAIEAKEEKARIKEQVVAAEATLAPLAEREHEAATKSKEQKEKVRRCNESLEKYKRELARQETKHDEHDDAIEADQIQLRSPWQKGCRPVQGWQKGTIKSLCWNHSSRPSFDGRRRWEI